MYSISNEEILTKSGRAYYKNIVIHQIRLFLKSPVEQTGKTDIKTIYTFIIYVNHLD